MSRKTNIYAIYAWEDKNVLLQIKQSLSALEENQSITIWDDDPILTGQDWKPKVHSRMDFADIFLLLVSTDFMKSKFIQQIEFKNIIDQYKANDAVVIPVLVDDCQWQIDFKSDEYDFNLNELQVLPHQRKSIENWSLPEEAFSDIAKDFRQIIADVRGETVENEVVEKEPTTNAVEDQLALSFLEDVGMSEIELAEQNREAEEKRAIAEAEAKRKTEEARQKAEEEQRLIDEAALKIAAEKEKRWLEEQAAKAKHEAAEEQRILQLELKRKAEEEKRQLEKAEAKAKREAEVEQRLLEERQKKAEAEKKLLEEEAQQLKVEQQRLLEEEEANKAYQQHDEVFDQEVEEVVEKKETSNKKGLIILGTILLIAAGIYTFSEFNNASEKPAPMIPEKNAGVNQDLLDGETTEPESASEVKPESEPLVDKNAFSDLAIGDRYEDGIIFSIDHQRGSAKIAYATDAGQMPWKKAMQIHEELGEGWRLPTFDELKVMYKTIGKGNNNSGNFKDELYWSSTLYQKIQSRLVRFSDGNTSFHYSNVKASRKFNVRAIKDINE
ncbi:TIR domain-containing protein [Aurantibacter crassamenti]|uniref:TIR domain-containing protein n=1 Tax=Aurantibacter crassamenti TaxID=1837375 RepID=UPI00193AAE12|nr:TIR domain-containing protein [Aurantibacter crassamenti]MBM1107287.1 TIR domain-containing protein [Aurantibacter crassamenti]